MMGAVGERSVRVALAHAKRRGHSRGAPVQCINPLSVWQLLLVAFNVVVRFTLSGAGATRREFLKIGAHSCRIPVL